MNSRRHRLILARARQPASAAARLTASLRTDAQCVEILFEVAFLFSNSNLRQHLFGALNIYTLGLHIRKIKEMSGANPGRYLDENKDTPSKIVLPHCTCCTFCLG